MKKFTHGKNTVYKVIMLVLNVPDVTIVLFPQRTALVFRRVEAQGKER